MDAYEETPGVINVAETCAASISIDDLVNLCEDPKVPHPLKLSKKLTYGAIRGSDALRQRLADLYSVRVPVPLSKNNILITPGASKYCASFPRRSTADFLFHSRGELPRAIHAYQPWRSCRLYAPYIPATVLCP